MAQLPTWTSVMGRLPKAPQRCATVGQDRRVVDEVSLHALAYCIYKHRIVL